VAVAHGEPKQAQALCDRFKVPFPCLADPKKDGYQAFDIKRGSAMEVAGPATWLAGLRAFRKGHRIETFGEDVYQLSATFIIDREGVARYARYAKHSGDHPKPSELVDALRGMGASSPG
jgi:peroxiredoxin